ncbi:Very-long-chain 3-oxoacyl-CoA reductase [Bertholletia excelsa]
MFSSYIHHLKSQPTWILFLSSLGLLSVLKLTFSLIKWVFILLLRPPRNLKAQYGPWAVVTGATDGIGKAFAVELAKTGLNLILTSRSADKLESLSRDIQTRYPNTQIRVVAVDFSDDIAIVESSAAAAAEGVEVGVVVNNVGVTYTAARYFDEVEEEVWRRVVRVNLEGTTRVTRALLPGMVKRRRGAIVNIGSGAGIVVPSHPLFAVYAATKAYVDQLSRCLYVEYKQFGIDVHCQVPLYVSTKMASKIASIDKPSFFVPSAYDYAHAAVRRIGYEARCTPYWTHSIQWFFASLLPEGVLNSWRLAVGIRRRGKVVAETGFVSPPIK